MTILHQASFPCPKCQDTRTHIERVVVSQGEYTTIVDSENDRLVPNSADSGRTGSIVETCMWCENGHTFTTSMEFIGGGVVITVEDGDNHDGDIDELWVRKE